MASRLLLLVLLSPVGFAEATAANPIRKVVSMLQAMQKSVLAEGEKDAALNQKFVCWCQTGGAELSKSIGDASDKMPLVDADIKQAESQLAQNNADVGQAQTDRDAAKAAVAEATAIREKDANAFAKLKSELDSTTLAIAAAVDAISKGMAGAFLQSKSGQILRKLTATQDMAEVDRQDLLSFLSNSQGYAPQSGQILGILKQLGDSSAARLADATAAEGASIKAYDAFVAAKTKEISELTKTIESKMARIGELKVRIVEMKQDLSDTQKAHAADKKFLEDMDKNCADKKAIYDENVKTRALELAALADTIKVLNDDDALELFKKTLPSASASFVQTTMSASVVRTRALAALEEVRLAGRPQLDLIALALRGKKVSFESVLKMIDTMVVTLGQEQSDDDHKKEYCAQSFDSADDKKKSLEKAISDGKANIAEAEDLIAKLTDEIAALNQAIKTLDQEVAAAGEQRQSEHAEYSDLMSSNSAAKDLLRFAKNRLNKFYNPSLYAPPPKRELSAEDRVVVSMGGTEPPFTPGGIAGTGISAFAQAAPPPPPATAGAYAKKSGESGGVIAMIDLLIKDLDKEMTEAETGEKEAQRDYVQYTLDSKEQRAADAKSLMDKENTNADVAAELEGHKGTKAANDKELLATLEYIQSLHAECDWLLQYFDVRKEARTGEVESLKNAKAILSGADYSLVQTRSQKFLSQ